MARYSLCGLDPRCLLCGAPASFPPCSLAARLPWKRIHSLLLRYLPICVPACVPDCLPIYLPGYLTPLLSSVSMTIVIHSQSSSLPLGVLSPQKAAKKCLPPPAPPQPFWKAPNGVIRPAGLIAPLDEGGLALVVMHSACPPMGGGGCLPSFTCPSLPSGSWSRQQARGRKHDQQPTAESSRPFVKRDSRESSALPPEPEILRE